MIYGFNIKEKSPSGGGGTFSAIKAIEQDGDDRHQQMTVASRKSSRP